jgi:hypothetical protein
MKRELFDLSDEYTAVSIASIPEFFARIARKWPQKFMHIMHELEKIKENSVPIDSLMKAFLLCSDPAIAERIVLAILKHGFYGEYNILSAMRAVNDPHLVKRVLDLYMRIMPDVTVNATIELYKYMIKFVAYRANIPVLHAIVQSIKQRGIYEQLLPSKM